MGEGVPLPRRTRAGDRRRLRAHRSPRQLAGAEPDKRQRAGARARRRPVRHARLRQSFSGSAGRRCRSSTKTAARVMGLEKDMVCVMIHSGSRGLGYQVCDDALRMLRSAPEKYGIDLPDRQLVCAPIDSPEGQRLPRRDARRGEFRLVQSPAADVAGPRGVRERLRPRLGRAAA